MIDVARALPRLRALPDDAGIALEGDKRFACVGPILKLLDGHVVAGLATCTAGEERPRDVDHVQRALALIEQRRAAPGTEAAGRLGLRVLEASDASLAAGARTLDFPAPSEFLVAWDSNAERNSD